MFVDLTELAEIREFAGTRHVTDRREQRVLHERPQKHIWTEPAGVRTRFIQERLQRDWRLTDEEPIAIAADWLACSVQMKQ
jgi:hypothetical protein